MELPHVFAQCRPLISSQTAAEIDAEIREELKFHLDMRTQDNLRAGMSAAEARRDAQQRFGNFEASHRACRQITLGPRLVVQRVTTGLLLVLIVAVVYQGVLLLRLQAASRQQIEALARQVEQLQAASAPGGSATANIPYVTWNREPRRDDAATVDNPSAHALAGWGSQGNPVARPWSDWHLLGEQ